MEWNHNGIRVTTNLEEMNIDFIEKMLRTSYWAPDRPRAAIEKSLPASICFGAFIDGRQVGFARIVTDRATICWLCDVIVDPDFRQRGIGKLLVQCVVDHPELRGIRMLLGTRDAHGLYARYGFEKREMMMRRAQ